MRRGLPTLGVVVACASLFAVPQEPATTPQRPTFRAATEVIAIDVGVVDRNGSPVKDLRADEFVVKVDGQPRQIASLQFVDQSVTPVDTRSRALSLRPVASSNAAGGGGRLILIVVDETSIRFGGLRATAESANRLLKGFGPADRIGLATFPGPRMLVEFGPDHARIVDALKRIPAGAGVSRSLGHNLSVNEAYAFVNSDSGTWTAVLARECPPGSDRGCPIDVQMDATELVNQVRNDLQQFQAGLRSLLQALAKIDVPKIVILFSEGLLAQEAPRELGWVANEAALARTVVHTMRLDRTMFDASQRNFRTDAFYEEQTLARTSLDALSGPTRGTSVEVLAGAEGPFDRLAREVSGFYLLGVPPEATDRDGKPHRIQVQVLRPGVTVRSRPAFSVPAPRANATVDEAKLLLDTMQSPMVATEIPLRLVTFNMADDDAAKVRVMVAAEIDHQQEKGGPARVGYAIYDDKGKPLVSFGQPVDLQVTESGALGFVSVSVVPAGTYTVKLAAVREGHVGSVEHRFTAKLTSASGLRLGDLIVADPIERDKPMPPSLDSHVVGDTILGYLQLRCNREMPKDARIVLEIVKTQEGPALLTTPLSVATSTSNVRLAQGLLEGRLLPPGEYGARATVTIADKPGAKLYTEFTLERTISTAAAAGRGLSLVAAPAPFKREDLLTPPVLATFFDKLPKASSEGMRAAVDRAKAGSFDEAVLLIPAAARNDPTPSFIRGLAKYSKGQYQPAYYEFRDAVRLSPEFLVGIFYEGACAAASGREQQAINAWQTSLVGLDDMPIVYQVIVDAMLRMRQGDEARDLLKEAADRWPDDEGIRLRAAKVAAATGHYEQVLEYLDRSADRVPTDPGMLFLAMHALFQQVLDAKEPPAASILERLTRYRDSYVAAGAPYQPLVAEWVAFVERKSKRTQ